MPCHGTDHQIIDVFERDRLSTERLAIDCLPVLCTSSASKNFSLLSNLKCHPANAPVLARRRHCAIVIGNMLAHHSGHTLIPSHTHSGQHTLSLAVKLGGRGTGQTDCPDRKDVQSHLVLSYFPSKCRLQTQVGYSKLLLREQSVLRAVSVRHRA